MNSAKQNGEAVQFGSPPVDYSKENRRVCWQLVEKPFYHHWTHPRRRRNLLKQVTLTV